MKHVLLPCQLKIQISPRSRPKFTQWDCRPWQFHPQQSTHTSSVTRKLVQSSFDDEFRSSQQIALGLHRRYKSVLEGGFTNNLRVISWLLGLLMMGFCLIQCLQFVILLCGSLHQVLASYAHHHIVGP
jgi:hypothetical protein